MTKDNIPIPDVVTVATPLDNNAVSDHEYSEFLQQHQTRACSAILSQVHGRVLSNPEGQIPSVLLRSQDFLRREINRGQNNQGVTSYILNNSQAVNQVQPVWYDSDQMDVPLLNPAADDSTFERELESWDHCHQRSTALNKQQRAIKQLISVSVLCLIFMIAEAVGGYFANSLAVMTDAAHMLSDFTSFLVSLFALWVSQRPPSIKMSFGYYRAEILGALVSVLIIWILTGVLVYLAIDRLIHREYDIDADTMIIISGVGVVMNIAMGAVLHGGLCSKLNLRHGHSHGNGNSHSHTHGHSRNASSRNVNVRAAFIHVIGDLVQSVGVLIAAFVIKYRPDLRIADPICTFLFSGLVLATTAGLIRDAIHVLMEGVPSGIHYRDLRTDLSSIEGVCSVHSLHIWSLTLDRNALAVHLAINTSANGEQILKKATRMLQTKYGIIHCTVQVERFNASAMEVCPQCTALID